jgi:hypothetical protein
MSRSDGKYWSWYTVGETFSIKAEIVGALLEVAEMYLAALDNDPENEMLTLLEAMKVTYLRDVVEDLKSCFE